MMEETRGVLNIKIKDATHIYITGTNRPHQAIFLVPIDEKDDAINQKFLDKPARFASEMELQSLSWVLFEEFIKLPPHKLDQSLLSLIPLLPNLGKKIAKRTNTQRVAKRFDGLRALQPRKRTRRRRQSK